jgi:hypothetical protein
MNTRVSSRWRATATTRWNSHTATSATSPVNSRATSRSTANPVSAGYASVHAFSITVSE